MGRTVRKITALEGVDHFESYVKAGRSNIHEGRGAVGQLVGGYPVLISNAPLRKKMVEKIRKDDPESVIYHIDEIVKINKLKPDIKGLKSIHYAKKVFGQSKLIAIN